MKNNTRHFFFFFQERSCAPLSIPVIADEGGNVQRAPESLLSPNLLRNQLLLIQQNSFVALFQEEFACATVVRCMWALSDARVVEFPYVFFLMFFLPPFSIFVSACVCVGKTKMWGGKEEMYQCFTRDSFRLKV